MLLAVRLVNCHVIGCKTRNSLLALFDPSIVPVSLLLVKLSVQSIVCLFWCRQLVVCKEQVGVGFGSVAFVLS